MINNLRSISYKSSMLNKYIANQKTRQEERIQSKSMVLPSFNEFALQKYKHTINAPELSVKTSEFPNNVCLYVDTNDEFESWAYNLEFIPQYNANYATPENKILSKILFDTFSPRSGFNDFDYWYSYMTFSNVEDRLPLKDDLDKTLNSIFTFSPSEAEFKTAKKLALKNAEEYENEPLNSISIYSNFKRPTFDELKKVRYEDVKKAYSDLLQNSQLRIALTAPTSVYNAQKDEILASLNKIPTMKQVIEPQPITEEIPRRTQVIPRGGNDLIDRLYLLRDKGVVEDDVKFSLLGNIFTKRAELISSELYVSTYNNLNEKAIVLSGEQNDQIDDFIESFKKQPITQKELDDAKKIVCKELQDEFTKPQYRNRYILANYFDKELKVSSFSNTINKTSALDMQEMAQTFFSNNVMNNMF